MHDHIDLLKKQATQLLKQLKQCALTQDGYDTAFKRLSISDRFSKLSPEEFQKKLRNITIEDCKDIIALEKNEKNWDTLIANLLKQDENLAIDELLWLKDKTDGILNLWFATYQEAKIYQDNNNGSFLFPFKKTYFVCFTHYLESLGVDAHDPDWELIGKNWAEPKNVDAKKRLRRRIIESRLSVA